jgi:hypothetical protein
MDIAMVCSVTNEARVTFESGVIDEEKLGACYETYAHVANIKEFMKIAKSIFLMLNCGLASVYLRRVLGGEIIRGHYDCQPHSFLLIDGFVVYITADQYGGPKVYVGPLTIPWSMASTQKIINREGCPRSLP